MKLPVKIIAIAVSVAALLTVPVFAQSPKRASTDVFLSAKETVNHDYFAAADSVRIEGTINGDAYIAGGMVTMDGTVNGDLFVAGGTVRINGTVLHDLRAAGGTVIVTGPVSGNVTAGGGTISFDSGATVKGSILAGAGTLELLSPVGRSVTAGAGNLTIGNNISGDIKAGADSVTLLPKAKVAGNLTYWSDREALIEKGATVTGSLSRQALPENMHRDVRGRTTAQVKTFVGAIAGVAAVLGIAWFILTYVVGLVLFALTPVIAKAVTDGIQKEPWTNLGLGLAVSIGIPLAGVILMVTVIGIPVGLAVLFGFGILLCIAHLYAALFAGTLILGWLHVRTGRAFTYLVGLLAFLVLTFIPIIGGLVKAGLYLTSLGSIVRTKYRIYGELRTKKII